MTNKDRAPSARRIFLRQVGGVSGAAIALPTIVNGLGATAPVAQAAEPNSEGSQPRGYLSLGPQEADCLIALVNVMCPADEHTPSGSDCGLHIYIDRQLGGAWGRGDRLYRQGPWLPGKPQHGYQSPLTPEQYFKEGLAMVQRVALVKLGGPVEQAKLDALDALLKEVAAGRLDDARFALSVWFNETLYPLFLQACFADPLYGGNRNKVFWRAAGYPGLPAFHGRNVVEFRGRRFTGANQPKSIEDFS